MLKRTVMTALAYVGLMVGAGFASGQEVLQYFVSFGIWGIVGAIVAALVLALTGMIVLQLGSYYRANEHSGVFGEISHPLLAKVLDAFITVTLFCIGLVMIAGAGANLEQQFGLPVWVGSAIMALLCIAAGLLDVERVATVIGAITPFIIVLVVAASSYAIASADSTRSQLDSLAATIPSTLPHWTLSSLNYVALALALGVSMAIVMGGDQLDPKSAGRGGLLGGLLFGGLLTIAAIALYAQLVSVIDQPMPMLELVDSIHPAAGLIMAIVIFGMIFNTGVGMFYALARRVSVTKPGRFFPALVIFVLVAFAGSFVGFTSLVAYLYPIIGYVGLLLIAILVLAWLRQRSDIAEEIERRFHIRRLARKKLQQDLPFSPADQHHLDKAISESVVDDQELRRDVALEVKDEIEADPEAELDASKLPPLSS